MNIVFFRYKNICEPDYIEAFKKLGINVVEVFLDSLGATDLESQIAAVDSQIRSATPMFVFTINFFPYISIVCEHLKVKYVSVSVTCPMLEIYNKTIRNSCNRVFLFDQEQFLSVRDENPEGIFHLALGAAVERLDAATQNAVDFKYDVSFVGSLYNEKDPFINLKISDEEKIRYEELMRNQMESTICGQNLLEEEIGDEDVVQIKLAADDFYPSDLSVFNLDRFVAINNYLSPHMTYLERVLIMNRLGESYGEKINLFTNSDVSATRGISCHGPVNTITEMPLVFSQSKINLNISTRSIKTGIPQRVWDVLGNGGFLLTNYQDELSDYFKIGEDIEVYNSHDELIEKIDYYLSHEDKRLEIAAKGYQTVKASNSTLNRVIEIIKIIAN
ncbi:glycosyltransferase family protein [Butyrivibrio sp. VCB2006]|uniref:glycosyltransferase family protein n=1 Tax=Butyrivibrio sp. VCB2006 TaxID=1280679 RepID=UPI000411CE27|nr:glycosyltransferase [Butyrivibrio sp. VCB2006]